MKKILINNDPDVWVEKLMERGVKADERDYVRVDSLHEAEMLRREEAE